MILQIIGVAFFVLAILSFLVEKLYIPRRRKQDLSKADAKPTLPDEVKQRDKEEIYSKVQNDLAEKAAIKKKQKDEEKLRKLQELSNKFDLLVT